MATAIILPKLDEAMLTGKIVKWLKDEGSLVQKGEGIVQIETEKVTFEIEAEESGILSKIMAKEGEEVCVGAVIGYIAQPGEKIPESAILAAAATETARIQAFATETRQEIHAKAFPTPPQGRVMRVSPLAKRIAQEHGVDVTVLKGTGPGGRIVKEDVLQAIEQNKVATTPAIHEGRGLAAEQVVPLSSMRKVIARRMTESFQSPHFYLTVEVEAQQLMKTNEQLVPLMEKKIGIRSTITDWLIKMVAKALEDNPSMNCAYVDGSVKLFSQIDIGLVVSIEGGLVVPVIRQANRSSLAEIAQARAELVKRARENRLNISEMKGSTFTISNLGMYGIDQFSAILQPPEAAILAVGRILDKPVAREGQVVVRPMMTMTLSIDHRVLDGVIGAQFLDSLKNYIENPALMMLKFSIGL